MAHSQRHRGLAAGCREALLIRRATGLDVNSALLRRRVHGDKGDSVARAQATPPTAQDGLRTRRLDCCFGTAEPDVPARLLWTWDPWRGPVGVHWRARKEGTAMPRRTIHNATVTLKLPFDIGASAELTALRAAGIPVDAMGNAERGFLFVRSTNGRRSQTTSFDGLPAKWGRCPA